MGGKSYHNTARATCWVRRVRTCVRAACEQPAPEREQRRRRIQRAVSSARSNARSRERTRSSSASRVGRCWSPSETTREASTSFARGLRFRGRCCWGAAASDSAPLVGGQRHRLHRRAAVGTNPIATRPFQPSDASSQPANSARLRAIAAAIDSRLQRRRHRLHPRQVEEVRHCRPPARQPGPPQVGECRLLVERRHSRPERPGIERVEDDAVGQAATPSSPSGRPPRHQTIVGRLEKPHRRRSRCSRTRDAARRSRRRRAGSRSPGRPPIRGDRHDLQRPGIASAARTAHGFGQPLGRTDATTVAVRARFAAAGLIAFSIGGRRWSSARRLRPDPIRPPRRSASVRGRRATSR